MSERSEQQESEKMHTFDGNTKPRCCTTRLCCLVTAPICFLVFCACLGGALAIGFLFPPFLSSFASKQIKGVNSKHNTSKRLL